MLAALSVLPEAEDKLLAAICYSQSNLPEHQLLERVRRLGGSRAERHALHRGVLEARCRQLVCRASRQAIQLRADAGRRQQLLTTRCGDERPYPRHHPTTGVLAAQPEGDVLTHRARIVLHRAAVEDVDHRLLTSRGDGLGCALQHGGRGVGTLGASDQRDGLSRHGVSVSVHVCLLSTFPPRGMVPPLSRIRAGTL